MSDKSKKQPKKKATPKEIAAAGGDARARALSDERKREIAKQAAAARWGDKPLLATHRGNFKEVFGIDVECYVLNDENRTAVVSKRGMAATLRLGRGRGRGEGLSGTQLSRFLSSGTLASYLGPELVEKIANPLVFQWPNVGPDAPPGPIHGYDVTIVIDICRAIITARAEGKLPPRYDRFVTQAQIILTASGKLGIKHLAYALAKYDATREEVITAFKFYVREEAREYEKEFPDQIYEEWYRLYKLPKPERNKPWKFMRLTIDHVYTPLAKSDGKILALLRDHRAASDDRRAKLHQFLEEVGVKRLRTHIGQLLGMAQISKDNEEYEKHVEKVFGVQLSLDFSGGKKEPGGGEAPTQ